MNIEKIKFPFAIPIAITYAFFTNSLTSRITGFGNVYKMCDNIEYQTYDNSDYKICNKKMNEQIEMLTKKNFMYMMALSLIGMIVGTILMSKYPSNMLDGGFGIALGAMLTMIYQLVLNWTTMKENFRLIVLGGIFVGLVMASYKLKY